MNILLDYLFPISSVEPTPAASTAFLKQVLVVAKPKNGGVQTGVITSCTTITAVDALVGAGAKAEIQKLFDAGMSKVLVLPMNDLDLAAALEGHESEFFTILVSSDFSDSDLATAGTAAVPATLTVGDLVFTAVEAGEDGNNINIELLDQTDAGEEVVHVADGTISILMKNATSTAQQIKDAIDDSIAARALVSVAIAEGEEETAQAAAVSAPLTGGTDATGGLFDVGEFAGVVGVSSADDTFLADQAALANRAAFHTTVANKAKNLFFAFGKLLSNALNWRNQQYISMPVADDVATVGDANSLFEDKISFVISDDEYSNRLALFAAGGKAIVAPYVKRNLQIDMQSKALQYISGNQPAYTKTQAALLEDELQKVIADYIERGWISAGTVAVELLQDNFVASGEINIAEPKALWRIFAEMRASL